MSFGTQMLELKCGLECCTNAQRWGHHANTLNWYIQDDMYRTSSATQLPKQLVLWSVWASRTLKCNNIIVKTINIAHVPGFQAALAIGLLGLRPWKPRFVGFLGVVASAINCYMLFPALPPAAAAAPSKPAPAQLAPPKMEVKVA